MPDDAFELTEAQTRVLLHCYHYVQWYRLPELARCRILEPDDVLVIPSLVELGLLMYFEAIKAVAITVRGESVAEAISARQTTAATQTKGNR